METQYRTETSTREQIDAMPGAVLLEFGANWCGHCMAAQAPLAQAMASHGALTHIKVEDGPGRPLGRSFRVKLWPTLIFLRDGQEVERLVRPLAAAPIADALARIDPPAP